MNDYKELIDNLRFWADGCDRTNNGCQVRLYLYKAADAIEQLVNDRNASVDALKALVENIDAESVRHEHWVAKKVMARTPFAINYYCSNCKFETDFCTKYCSNCGAKMDGVSE